MSPSLPAEHLACLQKKTIGMITELCFASREGIALQELSSPTDERPSMLEAFPCSGPPSKVMQAHLARGSPAAARQV